MPGLLDQNPALHGLLPDEQGILGPKFGNPLIQRQIAAQRAAYPRQQLNTPQQALDLGAGLMGMVPGIGDAMGLAADLNRYKDDPSSRTWGNFGLTGLGLLPFVPSMTGIAKKTDGYSGLHTAPKPDYGAPLHDLTGGGNIYPNDVYGSKAAQYYGHYGQNNPMDVETVRLVQGFKGKPDATVTVYRAVPKNAPNTINPGDWVTVNKNYATTHGEGPLQGDYKIVSRKVRADEIYTNGDSIHEWGYHPNKL